MERPAGVLGTGSPFRIIRLSIPERALKKDRLTISNRTESNEA
jgi:hypothetical protein